MFCKNCIEGLTANAVANNIETILCPYCQTQFFTPNDLIEPPHVVRQVLAHFRMKCPHEGCKEQIEYDQYDAHIAQCQFKRVICGHCNQEFQRIGKDAVFRYFSPLRQK